MLDLQKILRWVKKIIVKLLVNNDIHANSIPGSIVIGKHTYGVRPETISGATKKSPVSIGSFCSIAPGVCILAHVEHPLRLPSTYPFRTAMFNRERQNEESWNQDSVTRGPIHIGNDVWIGQNVIILSGVKIGDGAVVGAGAVVTKEIPSYAIAGGNPATIIRYRFPPDVIKRMQLASWWDLPDESLVKLEHFFYSEDIEGFIEAVFLERKNGVGN